MTAESLLASWNDTATRRAIAAFVQAVSSQDSDRFVPQPERVAVFDDDGTLWSDKPIPIQLDFTLFRMAAQASQDPAPWASASTTAATTPSFCTSRKPGSSTTGRRNRCGSGAGR